MWEYGLVHSVLETNLYLLTVAFPGHNNDYFASLAVGERDALLLEVRKNLFGSILFNTSNCPECGQKVEWETRVDNLLVQSNTEKFEGPEYNLKFEDHHIKYRLPNSIDIIELLNNGNSNDEVEFLLKKCILNSTPELDLSSNIPAGLKNSLVKQMDEQDPQANISINLTCPDCSKTWEAIFDITQFLWIEINNRAIGLLQDIHLLASNFSWSEHDILSMSKIRRSLYIKMITG